MSVREKIFAYWILTQNLNYFGGYKLWTIL